MKQIEVTVKVNDSLEQIDSILNSNQFGHCLITYQNFIHFLT